MKKFLCLQIGSPNFKNIFLGILVSTLLLNSKPGLSQTTNSGTDFWFGFTDVYDSSSASFEVYISSLVNASGTVSVPGQAFSQNFSVTPGTIARVVLPLAAVEVVTSEVLENKAVHVTSNNNVVVYAHTYHQYRSDASLILPVPSLGNDYYVASYNANASNPSEFLIIGSGTTTTVEITPSAATFGGKAANVPFNVTLNSGQVYQVKTNTGDLTGSRVRGLTSADKFSIIGGGKFPAVPSTGGGTKDPIYEQLFPVSSWGKNYVFVPTPLLNDDICRVIASQNGTSVTINGTPVATLNAGQFYEQSVTTASFISANKPVSVARYLKCATCVANPVQSPSVSQKMGDPSMVIIDANEQMFLDTITFYTSANWKIDSNYLQVVTRTADVSTIFLDGTNVGSKFSTLASNSLYSFMNTPVDTGAHTLKSNGCGFLAYITGLGGAESYAYAAGVALQNFTSVIPDSGCTGNNVQFSAGGIGSSTAWSWNFGDGNTSTLQNPSHAYATSGTYTVRLIITLNGGCTDTISKPVIISSCSGTPPVVNITGGSVCPGGCFNLTASASSGTPPYTYSWSPAVTGSGSAVSACPTATTVYTVTVTDSLGQTSSSTATVVVNPLPTVTFAPFVNSVCQTDPAFALTGGSPSGGTYSGTGVSGNMFDPAVAGIGTFTLTYNYTDPNGCSGSATSTITVDPAGTVSINSIPNLCITASPVTLSGSPAGGTFSGPGVSGNIFNPALAGSGTHTITYTFNTSRCLFNTSASTTVTVTPAPSVGILTPPPTGCNPGTYYGSTILTAVPIGPVASYQWYLNGVAISGATSSTYTATRSGWYNVVISANGCISDSGNTGLNIVLVDVRCGHDPSKKVVICHVPDCRYDKQVTICIGEAAVPAHLNNHACDCLGPCSTPHPNKRVAAPSGAPFGDLTAHPNPFKDETTLEFYVADDGPAVVELYDISGSLVSTLFSAAINGGELYSIPVDATHLPQGIYIVSLASGENIIHQKLVVTH